MKRYSEFHKDKSSAHGVTYYCKECANSKARKWHKKNGKSPITKKKTRARYLKTSYGITQHDFIEMFNRQHGKCAICFNKLQAGTYTHIDHCHTTDKVRGLLCTNCNRGLGHLQDSEKILENAIKYLKEHNE